MKDHEPDTGSLVTPDLTGIPDDVDGEEPAGADHEDDAAPEPNVVEESEE